jgi:hypothetical protein
LTGGSGGYIYIKTTNEFAENSIDEAAEISATGGYSVGNHTSGAGGVIVFDENFHIPFKQVHANGGVANDQGEGGCRNGAAGTVWMVQNDTLVVDNNKTDSTQFTTVRMPGAVQQEEKVMHTIIPADAKKKKKKKITQGD